MAKIIRKSTASKPHGEEHEKKAIRKLKHGVRGPVKFMGSGKKSSKRSKKY